MKMTPSSQQEDNRIDKRLYNKPRSAGSVLVHYMAEISSAASHDDEILYVLGHSYGEKAKRDVKPHFQKQRWTFNMQTKGVDSEEEEFGPAG